MGGATAYVLGGGGVLGAAEVGMIQALAEAGISPDLVVGTSVGAINGAVVAADPEDRVAERLTELWTSPAAREVFAASMPRQFGRLVKRGHAHSPAPLRQLLRPLEGLSFSDLKVPFQCCAASIERAAERWFDSGPLLEAVLASAAVPGLLPPVRIGDEHYLDGGLVNSIPVGRAVMLGAQRVFVLQVGRIERPLTAPKGPWEVANVAFEIARRHRFAADMAALPDNVEVHLLPTGVGTDPTDSLSPLAYRAFDRVGARIERAYAATRDYLATHYLAGEDS
jgi:NTE family protein